MRRRSPAQSVALAASLALAMLAAEHPVAQDPRAILLNPGVVNASADGTSWWLANPSLVVTWNAESGLRVASVYDRLGGRAGTKAGDAFTLTLPDGRVVRSTECRASGVPAIGPLAGSADAAPPGNAATGGRRLSATFACDGGNIRVAWLAELRPDAHAVVQRASLEKGTATVTVGDVGFDGPSTRPQPSPLAGGHRIVAGPYLQHPEPRSMTVVWVTDGPAVGWVEYGAPGEPAATAVPIEDGFVRAGGRIHVVRLDNLRPDAAYTYRTITRPILHYGPYKVDYAPPVRSDAHQFRTLSPPARPFSFIVFNDLHENVDVIRAHAARAAQAPYDLAFFNGDTLSHIESDEQIVTRWLGPAAEHVGSGVPLLFVRGNHETRGRHARALRDYLVLPDGRYYYAFDHGPVRFIVLDTGEDKEDSHWAYSGLTDFDAYRQTEAEWLRREVQTPAFRDATFRVLVAHMPFFGNGRTRVEGHGPTSNRKLFGDVLNDAGLDLHIAGHTHRADWVEPAAGANRFPVSVGGGSTPGSNTFTRVDVSAEQMVVTVTNDAGTVVATHTVPARRRGPRTSD